MFASYGRGAGFEPRAVRVGEYAERVVALMALDHLPAVRAQVLNAVVAGPAALGQRDADAFIGCHLKIAHSASRSPAPMTNPKTAPTP